MPLEKTEEIHKILQWQTIIYCLVKCSKKKTRNNYNTSNMIVICFSFMKHRTKIKNIDSRKLITSYYN